MPGRDGTGPLGSGPRTGWGTGGCPPDQGPGTLDQPKRGLGQGLGRGGRGRRMGQGGNRGRARFMPVTPPDSGENLESMQQMLQRLETLERAMALLASQVQSPSSGKEEKKTS
jgi:hypothetical protein